MLPCGHRQAEPARPQDAQYMPMGEDHDIALDGARPGDHPIGTGTHLSASRRQGSHRGNQPARREFFIRSAFSP